MAGKKGVEMKRDKISFMKANAVLFIMLLIVFSSSGCLDVHIAKDILVKEKATDVRFKISEHIIAHSFSTDPFDSTTWSNNSVQVFNIKNQTEFMVINVTTTYDQLPERFQDLLDQYGSIDRHVNVTLTNPEGEVEKTKVYNTSVTKDRFITMESPRTGEWRVSAMADGISLEMGTWLDYHDSYSIIVRINEPTVGATPIDD